MTETLQPPKWDSEHFEMCFAESLGLIVYCKTCEVAVVEWDSSIELWRDTHGNAIVPQIGFYEGNRAVYRNNIQCWAMCGHEFFLPTLRAVEEMNKTLVDQ